MSFGLSFMKKQPSKKVGALRAKFANAVANFIYGQEVYISSTHNTDVAGCVIFWYLDKGVKKFILVQNSGENTASKFVSCMNNDKYASLQDNLNDVTKQLLGEVFQRSIEQEMLSSDRVASVPVFSHKDRTTTQETDIYSLVWVIQITSEQAELALSQSKDIEVVILSEYNLLSQEIAPSHHFIYQSAMRHISPNKNSGNDFEIDQIEDIIRSSQDGVKVIH